MNCFGSIKCLNELFWVDKMAPGITRLIAADFSERLKNRERNLIAAAFDFLVVSMLVAALGDQEWFRLQGGKCPLKHLGTSLFYKIGSFRTEIRIDPGDAVQKEHSSYLTGHYKYVDCVTPPAVDVFHGLIALGFVGVGTTIVSLLLNLFGTRKNFAGWLRRNGVFSIFSVIFAAVVLGLAYWLSVMIETQQKENAVSPEDVTVSYENGFYLVLASGIFSVCSIAANLISSFIRLKRRAEDQLRLMENLDERHAGHSEFAEMLIPQPPPPYSP